MSLEWTKRSESRKEVTVRSVLHSSEFTVRSIRSPSIRSFVRGYVDVPRPTRCLQSPVFNTTRIHVRTHVQGAGYGTPGHRDNRITSCGYYSPWTLTRELINRYANRYARFNAQCCWVLYRNARKDLGRRDAIVSRSTRISSSTPRHQSI